MARIMVPLAMRRAKEVRMVDIKPCYDGGTCRNEDTVEDLADALAVAVAALRQYAAGRTWRHIAVEALEELERRGMVESGGGDGR